MLVGKGEIPRFYEVSETIFLFPRDLREEFRGLIAHDRFRDATIQRIVNYAEVIFYFREISERSPRVDRARQI